MIKKRILVVEDEQVIRNLFGRFIDPEFELILAPSVLEGKRHIENQALDLLITDLRLTDGCGTEVIHHYKSKFPSHPAIVITGSLTPENRLEHAAELGVTECIYKPFDINQLQDAIHRALSTT